MHLKRKNIKNFWSIPRKGTKYISVSSHNKEASIPLMVVMRDLLHLVRSNKELKKIIHEKKVLINGKYVQDTNYPLCLFDILYLPDLKKNYRATLSENNKMIFEDVDEKSSHKKLFKIIGKKIVKGGKTQVNLMHGRNLILKEKIDVNDSLVFNFKENKTEKIIKVEKGKDAFVFMGKHAGNLGKIEDVIERGGKKLVKISTKSGKINVWIKNIIAMES